MPGKFSVFFRVFSSEKSEEKSDFENSDLSSDFLTCFSRNFGWSVSKVSDGDRLHEPHERISILIDTGAFQDL